jgi:hypothetical protein
LVAKTQSTRLVSTFKTSARTKSSRSRWAGFRRCLARDSAMDSTAGSMSIPTAVCLLLRRTHSIAVIAEAQKSSRRCRALRPRISIQAWSTKSQSASGSWTESS